MRRCRRTLHLGFAKSSVEEPPKSGRFGIYKMQIKPIKVGLVGYGRAGKIAAQEILKDPDLRLAWIARQQWESDPEVNGRGENRRIHIAGQEIPALRTNELASRSLMRAHRTDLVVDLAGSAAINSYAHLAERGTRIVSAVSHYEPGDTAALQLASVRTAVLHSPNITLGINLILVLARALRKLIPHADIQIVEEHFSAKPGRSGTAEQIARILGLELDDSIHSVRAGGIIGKHELIFGLPNQTIRLVHESINRAAFARGALLAGKWLMESEPDFYTMEKLVFRKMRMGFLADAEEEGA